MFGDGHGIKHIFVTPYHPLCKRNGRGARTAAPRQVGKNWFFQDDYFTSGYVLLTW
jgi:hypothetical protein